MNISRLPSALFPRLRSLGRYVPVRLKNHKTTISAYVSCIGTKPGWAGSQLNNKGLRRSARRLGSDSVKRANTERKHDNGAKRVKGLLHEFLQNEDADTSRLDAHGSLSSRLKPG